MQLRQKKLKGEEGATGKKSPPWHTASIARTSYSFSVLGDFTSNIGF